MRFDWIATVLSLVFLGGVYVDGWAHSHGRVDDSFFTPWHAVLYSGFLAMAALLLWRAAWRVARGTSWRAALPDGYALSLLGVALWFVGGPFDLAWHSVFGFEANVEALLSPAHTILALGAALMTSGPLRAALRRPAGRWRDELPMVLSLTCVVATLTFFTQIAHPLANLWAAGPWPASSSVTELGIVSMQLTTVILIAPLLLLLRHDRLPAGATTMVVGLDGIATGFLFDHGPYPLVPVLGVAAAAVAGDLLRAALRPSASRPAAFRWFALAVPALLSTGYFAALALTAGIAYTPHLWMGVIVFAGVIGWLFSYLVLPPRGATGYGAAGWSAREARVRPAADRVAHDPRRLLQAAAPGSAMESSATAELP